MLNLTTVFSRTIDGNSYKEAYAYEFYGMHFRPRINAESLKIILTESWLLHTQSDGFVLGPSFTLSLLPTWDPCLRLGLGLALVTPMLSIYMLTSTVRRAKL